MPLYVSYAVRAAHCTNSVNAIFVNHLVHSISCEVMILGDCFQPSLVVFYFLDHFLFRFAIFFRAHHRRVFFFFFFFKLRLCPKSSASVRIKSFSSSMEKPCRRKPVQTCMLFSPSLEMLNASGQ